MKSGPEILIIDDEPQIRKLLCITLQNNGYGVIEACDGKSGLALAAQRLPDLILLDLGLPDIAGHEILSKLREWYKKAVVIISVQKEEEDIILALDHGANDYIIKPFRTGELLARIRSALRHSEDVPDEPVVSYGELRFDFTQRAISKGGIPVHLTTTEYALMLLFVRNEGKVLTHHYLLNNIWGPGYTDQSQYLRVFIAQIRKKIEPDANRPSYIRTESGVGYRFVGNQ